MPAHRPTRRVTRGAVSEAGALFARHLVLLLLLLPAACEGPQHPLRVGTNAWAGYMTLAYSVERGLLDPRQVRILEFDTAGEVMRAFRNNAIDAAAVTLDQALLLSASRQEPVVVLVLDASRGADALLARPEITSLSELRGRRVAVETNALGAYMLARVLAVAGLSPGDLEILNLAPEKYLRAYREGRVDALIAYEPQRSRLLAAGAHELFSSREIPGEVMDVVVVRQETLERRQADLQLLADAHFAALARWQAEPAEVAEVVAPHFDTTPETLASSWALLDIYDRADNRRLLAADGSGLADTIEKLEKVMVQTGLMAQVLDHHPVLDDRLARGGEP